MLLIAILSNTLIDGKKTIPKSKNIHKKTDDDNVNKNGNKDVIDDEALCTEIAPYTPISPQLKPPYLLINSIISSLTSLLLNLNA